MAAHWIPDIILGINRGGCVPGVYLSHKLNKPHEVIDVRLRDHATLPNLSVLENALTRNKKVLIIDDINDSGATFDYILNNLETLQDDFRLAVLLSNVQSTVTVHFYGEVIDKSLNPEWIVFPWEAWS